MVESGSWISLAQRLQVFVSKRLKRFFLFQPVRTGTLSRKSGLKMVLKLARFVKLDRAGFAENGLISGMVRRLAAH